MTASYTLGAERTEWQNLLNAALERQAELTNAPPDNIPPAIYHQQLSDTAEKITLYRRMIAALDDDIRQHGEDSN